MRKITHCLNPSLITLCQRAIELESLTTIVQHYFLPSEHVPCTVGSFNKGCLVLVTHDPVWASALRYRLPELRDYLRKNAGLHQLITIKISIAFEQNNHAPTAMPHTAKPKLSDNACQIILSSSEQCNYLPLQQALQRLGKNVKPQQERID